MTNTDELIVEAMDAAIEWINFCASQSTANHPELLERLKKAIAVRDEARSALQNEPKP